jgi:hypothetical protein
VTALVALVVAAAGTSSLALAKGWVSGAGAASNAPATDWKKAPEVADPATENFPKNRWGQTYGSDAMADSEADAPDLIAAVGDAGISGYVRKTDLYGPDFRSPEEALAWESEMNRTGGQVLAIYNLDGEKIDTLRLGTEAPQN